MKRQLLGVAAFMLALSAHAQDNPLWMRYCAISPDGTSIAFTYKGDIYTVPVNGGKAARHSSGMEPRWKTNRICFRPHGQYGYIRGRQRGRHPKKINHSLRQRNTRSIQGCRPYPVSGKCNAVSRRCPVSIRTIPTGI